MAHFPQPHNRVRAPRVRVPNNESVKFNLGGRQVNATLSRLSMTGGLVQFNSQIGDLGLAEVALTTSTGQVKALVEFLKPQAKETPQLRPFRFVALDDPDYQRLAATLQLMTKQGFAENPR